MLRNPRQPWGTAAYTWVSETILHHAAALAPLVIFGSSAVPAQDRLAAAPTDRPQVPSWSADDLEFFLHGSMGTEVVPEAVWRAFRATYPELWPGHGSAPFGLIALATDELPIGLSRREVPHLGGLRAVGINCAACHVANVIPAADRRCACWA